MRNYRFCILTAAALVSLFPILAAAQTTRLSVPAAEVNGTFRRYFTGKFKGSSSEIKLLALGRGKVRVAMDLMYPYISGDGELTANMGQLDAEADIEGDVATVFVTDFRPCKIIIRFVRAGRIKVTQEGTPSACGFGNKVTADGIYTRVSSRKPKFETN